MVVGPELFVGRRRLLQRCVRKLRDRDRAGVVLHGAGNNGKSSLAARVVDRMRELDTVVIWGTFDAHGLMRAIYTALGDRVRAWYETWSNRSAAELGFAITSLLDGELGARQEGRAMLLVLDDFEQLLDTHGGARHRVKPHALATVRALVQAFHNTTTRSRFSQICTSRPARWKKATRRPSGDRRGRVCGVF